MPRFARSSAVVRAAFTALAILLLIPFSARGDDPPAWDVNAAPGPDREVAIDVDQGTWMSLDVSPDGTTIAFDLLGDLYLLPIAGGDARALTHDPAFQMQPRFSPDGKSIAFTSDEGGGDNLWIMDVDGSHRRQVTKEDYRLVSSPAWSPDGMYLAGRKHFTSRRSLGAGEMWLYHVSGGEGLQMTTRPTDQKDVGEPAFSPNGRYLYYSFDATPGGEFEYNKDSNAGIYAVNRLDRETGEVRGLLSGPGGACRPTPSPDGKRLAFVRRVRFQSTLQLLDLESGATERVFDGLERDMQETWAIHGTYPTIAWTPDGGALVFWARGGLHRLDLATRAVTPIPFHVHTTLRTKPALRFAQDVAPDEFDVKALRWVRVAPDGNAVVYQALGHLWRKELPDGEPRRLTSQTDHFEFCPSFSRDGASIVYTTWNDESFGTVRVVPATGGEGRVLTREPGHYVDPVFSPDGARVVFGRVSGGPLTSNRWSYETGVFAVPAAGGPATRVSVDGRRPQFGADSDRVYLETSAPDKENDNTALVSMKLDGADRRTELTSDNATQFSVAPDGNTIAFVERWNVHVSPFVPTGRARKVGPGSNAVPVARLSRDAGENLQWSGDSRTVYWSLGPQLFHRALSEAFPFEEGAPDPLPKPPESGTPIGFKARYARPDGFIALVGARVVTMRADADDGEVLDDATIVVEGNRIRAIGPRATTPIPEGARVVDVAGKTITPGWIDVHAHGAQAEDDITPQKNWIHYANLAFGVTTIHDPSNDTNSVFAVSEMAKAGEVLSPRTFSTGTILYGATGAFKAEIGSLDDALSHLRRLKAVGAFSVKSYNQPRRAQRQQVIEAARELQMMVVPEGGSTFMHNLTMVVDGHTGIEHTLSVERIYEDVTQLWSGSGVGLTPTLIVGYGGIWGEDYWYDVTNVYEDEHLLRFVPRAIVDPRSRRREKAPLEEYNHFNCARICKDLVDAGARVQLGAHGQLAGLGAHWELWMLGQGGLHPMQALRAATLDGARYLGLDRDLGSLEPGKLADLLVFDGNPLDDLQATRTLRFTMLNGRLFDSATMAAADGGPERAPVFFFSDDGGALGARRAVSSCAGCPGAAVLESGHDHRDGVPEPAAYR